MRYIVLLFIFFSSQICSAQTEVAYYADLLNKHEFSDYPIVVKCEVGVRADSLQLSDLIDLPIEVKESILHQFKYSNNFIGSCFKYAIWGCGSPCQMLAIFRFDNGQLIGTQNASLGFSIKHNSRLIIVNPPTDDQIDVNYRRIIGEPKFYQLTNNQLLELK